MARPGLGGSRGRGKGMVGLRLRVVVAAMEAVAPSPLIAVHRLLLLLLLLLVVLVVVVLLPLLLLLLLLVVLVVLLLLPLLLLLLLLRSGALLVAVRQLPLAHQRVRVRRALGKEDQLRALRRGAAVGGDRLAIYVVADLQLQPVAACHVRRRHMELVARLQFVDGVGWLPVLNLWTAEGGGRAGDDGRRRAVRWGGDGGGGVRRSGDDVVWDG